FEQMASHEGGYVALPESEGKYELILHVLNVLVLEADDHGYTEMGAQCLRVLYGPRPALAKEAFLINEYKSLKTRSKREMETKVYQHTRELFMKRLTEEISRFETLRDCLRRERTTLFDLERDSLLLGEKAAKILAREETRLRNSLQQTFKQLLAWREKQGQEEPVSSAAGGKPSGSPSSSPNGRPGAGRRGGDGAPAAAAGVTVRSSWQRKPKRASKPAQQQTPAAKRCERIVALPPAASKTALQPPHSFRFAGHPLPQRGEGCGASFMLRSRRRPRRPQGLRQPGLPGHIAMCRYVPGSVHAALTRSLQLPERLRPGG